MAVMALDTSVAVAHLLRSHTHHHLARRALDGFSPVLTAHSLAETYSVLTRLPGDARLDAHDAAELIESNYGHALTLPAEVASRFHTVLAEHRIAGGAVYDALVGLTALHHDVPLSTRDARAATTYAALSVQIRIIAD